MTMSTNSNTTIAFLGVGRMGSPMATRLVAAGFLVDVYKRQGMRHAGTLPVLAHNLPDEEGATIRAGTSASSYTVGIVRYPYASNLDEFHLLAQIGEVSWITNPRHLRDCDLAVSYTHLEFATARTSW